MIIERNSLVELDAKEQEKKHRQELEEAKELVIIFHLSGQNEMGANKY